jgi:hypothetical protein
MTERETTIVAVEHASASEAIQHLEVSNHDRAVLLDGKYLTMTQAEANRLEVSGMPFAYLVYHEPTGRIMTIPVEGRSA